MTGTSIEQKERTNNLISSIPNSTEDDKLKIYSWKSINAGLIEIFTAPEKGAWNLRWCEECNS